MNRRLTAAQRDALLQELFAPSGLNLTVTRIPMGASDFSLTHGTYDDVPQGGTDPELEKFSLARAQADVLPLAREALRINPSLKVFISPWSAPAWMKTTGSLIKGGLDPRYYDAFARYFDRTIAGFRGRGRAGLRADDAERTSLRAGRLSGHAHGAGRARRIHRRAPGSAAREEVARRQTTRLGSQLG